MAGIVGSQVATSQPPQSAQMGTGEEVDEQATPEEQEAYERAVAEGMNMLYMPGAAKVLKRQVEAANDPVKAAATIARDTMAMVDKKLDCPETVIAHAAQELLMTVLELMTDGGYVEEEELPEITAAASEELQVMLEDYYDDSDESAPQPSMGAPQSASPAPQSSVSAPEQAAPAPQPNEVMA